MTNPQDPFAVGGSPGLPDPGMELKKGGLPWPVYLAIGIALMAGIGFMLFRSSQNRQKRLLHANFMQEFVDFEKKSVNEFWKCLFGKDADGRRWNEPSQLNGAIESALYADPKTFPEKVSGTCVKKALDASAAATKLNPPAGYGYEAAIKKYSESIAALANTLNTWSESAGKRVEVKLRENKVVTAGETWSTTADLKKPDPLAWQYDVFLHCALPEIDTLKDTQAVLETLAKRCTNNSKMGFKIDSEFLGKLRDKCIPAAQEAPTKAPATFKKTFEKFAAEYDRLAQAWGSCFRAMNKEAKKDDLDQFDKAWVDSVNSSTDIRKIGSENLKDD